MCCFRLKHLNFDFGLSVVSVQHVPNLVVTTVSQYINLSINGVLTVVDSSTIVHVVTGVRGSASAGGDVNNFDGFLFVAGEVALLNSVQAVTLLDGAGVVGSFVAFFVFFNPFTVTLVTFPSESFLAVTVNATVAPARPFKITAWTVFTRMSVHCAVGSRSEWLHLAVDFPELGVSSASSSTRWTTFAFPGSLFLSSAASGTAHGPFTPSAPVSTWVHRTLLFGDSSSDLNNLVVFVGELAHNRSVTGLLSSTARFRAD